MVALNQWLHTTTQNMTMTHNHTEPASSHTGTDSYEWRIRLTARTSGSGGLISQSTAVASIEQP